MGNNGRQRLIITNRMTSAIIIIRREIRSIEVILNKLDPKFSKFGPF